MSNPVSNPTSNPTNNPTNNRADHTVEGSQPAQGAAPSVTPAAGGLAPRDPGQVDRWLAELSVTEKASLTSGSTFWRTAPVERLGIPSIMMSDGPHGLRTQTGEGDHVGLAGSVPATCFPTASAIASSWNPDLMFRVGAALAREARTVGVSVVLGPGMNIKRSPLCGRNFEYFSEDPYLTGELAAGVVEGLQSGGVGASAKHYAANNQETDRLRVNAVIDERTLREIYLPAFEKVVTVARPWTVMCAYNKVNGQSASENEWLLTTVLRDEFGFDGVVVSDWGAVYHRVPALLAGLDLEMPPALGRSPEAIVAAVASGEVSELLLDARARTVLELVSKAQPGLAEAKPGVEPGAGVGVGESVDLAAQHQLARAAAAESVVVLTNDGILPLPPEAKVAVVGEFARTPRYQGAGSSQVNSTRVEVLIEELRDIYGDVSFAAGYSLGPEAANAGTESELVAEAVAVAETADTVIMVVGLPAADESEGYDRAHMNLPVNQLAVLSQVAAANPNVVVVVVNGSAVLLGEVTPHARALVEAWLGGQAAAGGISDVLSGAVNPSGRLAETIPLRLEDNSSYLNFPGELGTVRYGEGVFVGYRGYDRVGTDVAFPFGYGLSYTTFELSNLTLSVVGTVTDDEYLLLPGPTHQPLAVQVKVHITNTGTRQGQDVVQVYVRDLHASVNRPVRELKGFAKMALAPGETRQVTITLDQRAFSFWSPAHRRWVVEAGDFRVDVGRHSRDVFLSAPLTVEAPSLTLPLTVDSTLHEWINDTRGRGLIEEEIRGGQPATFLDPHLVEMIGTMPMSTLASFGGISLDHDAVARVAKLWATDDSQTGLQAGPRSAASAAANPPAV